MSKKARRRPSWKKNRENYYDSKYYHVFYDKYSGFMSVFAKEVDAIIAEQLRNAIDTGAYM